MNVTFKKRFLLFTILFALFFAIFVIFARPRADGSTGPELVVIESDWKFELELLKSKISELVFDEESQMNQKIQQLRSKDELINQKEKTTQQNSESISYSQSDLVSVQAHASLPDWLIANLIRTQYFFEMKWNKHGKPDMESAIQKILVKTTQVGKWVEPHYDEIRTVHAWLPDWLMAHLIRTRAFLQMDWSKQGKSAMKSGIEKILEKTTSVGKWVEPHYENIRTVHASHTDWLISYFIRTRAFLQMDWSKQGKSAMKSVIKNILERKNQAKKWVEHHFENLKTILEKITRAVQRVILHFENNKTYFLQMDWNELGKHAIQFLISKMEWKVGTLFDLIELLSKTDFGITQILHENVNKKESILSKSESYKAQTSNDILTSDPYSIEECMDALKMIADLDDNCFNMALDKFKDGDWRKMFIKMPSSRRKQWLQSLV